MIEVLNPAWLAIIVDEGRYGLGHIGVPPSGPLDLTAYRAVNTLLGNAPVTPVLEVMGSDFRIAFGADMRCALAGARVEAFLDGVPVHSWTSFRVSKGSMLRVREVREGLRYYIGVSGVIDSEEAMGSRTTNLECLFGGYHGRPLMKGDRLTVNNMEENGETRSVPEALVPSMAPPHLLRLLKGPEFDSFTAESLVGFVEKSEKPNYTVTTRLNRTGIRIEGPALQFREAAEKSIISEGVVPGTVQVPGDGLPIIVLYERTIGGYARVATVIRADLDRLAHLKPRDPVHFRFVGIDEALQQWEEKKRLNREGLPI
jgi:5-oxoprolinase (ATP-hydrolysing) subunit C